jgi:type II secretion system protein D
MNPMPITSPLQPPQGKEGTPPVVISPVAPVDQTKLADKKVNFEMRDKPWKNVLEWLCNETGMPIIANAIPTGSFTFYGNPKQTYRIPQIIDFLNDALTEKKYVIIRRQAVISVVPADQQIDPSYVPQIAVDQLKNYGATEIVKIIYQLKTTNAEDLAPEISKMMGPFKEVMPLTKSNQLILQDSAVTLQHVIDTIKQMEENETGQTESYSHKCEYIKAREAERILKELLGDPAALLRQMQAGQQQPQQPGQPNNPNQQQKAAPNVAMPKSVLRPHYVSVDDRLGVVLITGSADKIAQAKSILRNIDVPQYPGQKAAVPSAPMLKNYATAPGAAEALAKTLSEIYKTNAAVRIVNTGGSAIMVLAGAEDQIDIARLIAGGDIQSSETAIIPISALDVEKTATTLKGMFQGSDATKSGGPYIEGDTGRGAIIVKGTPAQVADVKAFIKLSEGDAGTSPNMRIISLDRGNAAALAAEIERLMNQTRRNPVRVVTPNVEPAPAPTPPPKPPVPQSGNGGGQDQPTQLVDPKTQPGSGEPVTISIIGNRLVITSKDPAAVQMASELARMIISAPAGEGEFEIIKLKNANATDAARIIDEMYNGPRTNTGQQIGGFPFGGPFGPRFGMQSQSTTSTAPSTAKVRVIADPASNSLLVKASPVDLLSIKKYLKDGIDSGPTDGAAQTTHVIGPLKAARAEEVVDAIRDVYRDSIGSNSPQIGRGGNPFFGGGMPAQKITDANGNPRPAALTVSANEPTNTVIVKCSESLYKEVETLVKDLDNIAKGSPRTIKIVSVKGIDPNQLQQAIDALQGGRNRNNNNFGNFGGFGGGPFGGGNRFGGGGGNRGGRGGMGNRLNRQPDREPGGPDFFEQGVMDDRQNAGEDAANFSILYDPQASRYSGEEQQQPPARPNQPPSTEIRAPLENVDVQALEQLGVIILRTQTQADMDELEKLIKYLQDHAEKAEVGIMLVPLKQGDATHIAATLNQVFARVVVGPTGNTAVPLADQRQQAPQRSTNPFFGTSVTTTDTVGSILVLPYPRFNAIIVGAPKTRFEYVMAEINKLDQPNSPAAGVTYFPLRKAPAVRVANQIRSFYANRYSNETDVNNQIRITHDDASNTIMVQASPADLAEIRSMIERIDSMVSNAVNELRIIPLHNALPDELANTLMAAITQGVVAPTTAPTTTGPQNQLNPFIGGQQQPRPVTTLTPPTNTTKTTTLRFYAQPGPGGVVESGLLEDVHITPEFRSNSLIVSAPPRTMDLIVALVSRLDVISSARAEMKIFTLKKADASQTAALLQQFFLGAAAPRPATPGPTAPGGLPTPALPVPATAGSRPLLALSDMLAEGATLVDLKISVDDRSNSIIVAGSRNDLSVIEAIISRMEDNVVQTRRNEVYKLRNAAAADVATAVQTLMSNSLTVLSQAGQLSNYQQLIQNVVIVPEPISNTLLISSSPEYFEEVMRIVAQIDTMPPQVLIQCLVAEVRLNGDEEFGVEIGLQSPILFQRSVLPSGVTINNTTPNAGIPGFNFNTTAPLPNSTLTGPGTPVPRSNSPGIVGFQGLGNLGVGRASPTANIGGLVFSAASDTFSVLVRALKMQNRLDVLSRPQIMTLDNQTAALLIGENVPYLSTTSITATGIVTPSFARRDVGVLLRVTPRITPEGKVLMRVFPEVSSKNPVPVDLGNGNVGTSFFTQEVETTVVASDNETVIIGGLISTSDTKHENKVPGLGDLPYVGAAFRYRTQSREKRELIVILTPRIVRSQEDMCRLVAEEARRMEWIVGDVCRVHGPGGLECVLPKQQGQQGCDSGCPLPMLNTPSRDLPNSVPMITPPTAAPIVVPSTPAMLPVRPAVAIPDSPPGSPVLPATYDTAPQPPSKDKGKDSRPWVFQRG